MHHFHIFSAIFIKPKDSFFDLGTPEMYHLRTTPLDRLNMISDHVIILLSGHFRTTKSFPWKKREKNYEKHIIKNQYLTRGAQVSEITWNILIFFWSVFLSAHDESDLRNGVYLRQTMASCATAIPRNNKRTKCCVINVPNYNIIRRIPFLVTCRYNIRTLIELSFL